MFCLTGWEDALSCMFTVYFDDSGTHLESNVAVAACYVGTDDQWACLARDWETAQVSEGFKVFGMADILNGKGEYRSWSAEKRDRLIRRLITITRIRARKGFSVAVVKSDYDSEITGRLRGKAGKFHYSFAVRGCRVPRARGWRVGLGVFFSETYNLELKTNHLFSQ